MACRRPSSSTGAGGSAPSTSAHSRTRSSGLTSSGCSRSPARRRRRRPRDRERARPAVGASARVVGDRAARRSRDARADPARDGGRAVTGFLVAALVLGVPALAFALWPLLGARGRSQVLLRLPPDRRGELAERKAATLRALRELSFEHDAGHIGDADYAELSARYEGEAAAVLTELDRLGPAAPAPSRPPTGVAESRSAWRHPAALATGAILLVLFGIAIGAGVVRYTEPDRPAAAPRVGAAPLAPPVPTPGGGGPPGAGRAVTPEVLQGMLRAARASLFEGRYGEAIAAYQAVLKRDPKNVDALTHLGLIVALGGHADTALETLDRALAIDPNYPPALLSGGCVRVSCLIRSARSERSTAARSLTLSLTMSVTW